MVPNSPPDDRAPRYGGLTIDGLFARLAQGRPTPWTTRKHQGEDDMVRQLHWVSCAEPTHSDCAVCQTVHPDIALVRLGHVNDDATANAELIVAAVNALPDLLSAVGTLGAALDAAHNKKAAYRVENEQLRQAIADAMRIYSSDEYWPDEAASRMDERLRAALGREGGEG